MSTTLSKPFQFSDKKEDLFEGGGTYELIPDGTNGQLVLSSETCLEVDEKYGVTYIKIVWTIQEGPYARRKIWDRIAYENGSEGQMAIGRKKLNLLGKLFGIRGAMVDVTALNGRYARIDIKVWTSKANKQYNQVGMYHSAETGAVGESGPITQAADASLAEAPASTASPDNDGAPF